jgi:integrase
LTNKLASTPFKVTKRAVDSVPLPFGSDVFYWDAEMKRFGLRVKPSGAKTYVVQYRNAAGQSKRLTVGRAGVLTPEEARKAARAALASVEKGNDPAADKRQQRADLTLADLVGRYLKEGPADKPDKKASSWATDASSLRSHAVPLLGRRRISTLTKDDVQRFQADVTAGKSRKDAAGAKRRGAVHVRGGAGAAQRATATLASTLAWAVEKKLLKENPAQKVRLNKLQSRESFLNDQEIARLGEKLAQFEAEGVNPDSLAIVRLLLLTGARRNEIASAKWQHVDFQRGALLLPDSKTGRKTIPLAAPALAVFAGLRRDDRSAYVFPATRGRGFNVGIAKIWNALRAAAGLKGVRLHDLRHSFASVGVGLNQSLFIVGKILGHTRAATTERYSHLALDAVRAAAEQSSRRLSDALNGRKAANVVRLKHARK